MQKLLNYFFCKIRWKGSKGL